MSMQDNTLKERDLQPSADESDVVRRARSMLWQWHQQKTIQLRDNNELVELGTALSKEEAFNYGRRIFALALKLAAQVNANPVRLAHQ